MPEEKPKKKRNQDILNRKAKGRNLTKKIRQDLIDVLGLNPEQVRPAIGFEHGTDIKLNGEAKEIFNIGLEMKNHKKISMGTWLEQAVKNAKAENYETPALVHRKSIQGNDLIWLTIPWTHYLEIREHLLALLKEQK